MKVHCATTLLLQLNRLELDEELSCEVDISIDPHRLTEPGRLHIAHVIATMTYSGDHDNYTDFNTGERVAKTTDNAYTSFYFYVLGLYGWLSYHLA